MHVDAWTFLNLFLPTVFAAGLAFIPSLLILPISSSNHFSHLLLSSIHQTSLTLPINLKATLAPAPAGTPPPATSKALRQFPQLLAQVYQELSFEISYSKLHPRTLEVVLTALRRVQRNPLLGGIDVGGHLPGPRVSEAMRRERERRSSGFSTPTGRTHNDSASSVAHYREALTGPFIDSSFALAEEIVACLNVSREMLVVAYGWVDIVEQPPTHKPEPSGLMERLAQRLSSFTKPPVHPVTGRRMSTHSQRPANTPPDLQDRVADARKGLQAAMHALEQRLTELVEGSTLAEGAEKVQDDMSVKSGKVHWASEDAQKKRRANVLLAGKDRFRLAFHLTALLDVSAVPI
jgi:hypothetical protein